MKRVSLQVFQVSQPDNLQRLALLFLTAQRFMMLSVTSYLLVEYKYTLSLIWW